MSWRSETWSGRSALAYCVGPGAASETGRGSPARGSCPPYGPPPRSPGIEAKVTVGGIC